MKVFISYSHIDEKYVEEIASFFEEKGIQFFLDRKDIGWGDNIKKRINEEMAQDITHELVVLSPASVESQWVAYEIGFASAKGITILPYLVHPSLKVPTFISEYHYITKLEDLKKYFDSNIKKTYLNIVNEDGTEEKVEVVIAFEFKDTKNEYVVYTKREKDPQANVTVYVSLVDRNGKTPKLNQVPSEEWERVKGVLRKLSTRNGGNNSPFMSNLFENVIITNGDGVEIL